MSAALFAARGARFECLAAVAFLAAPWGAAQPPQAASSAAAIEIQKVELSDVSLNGVQLAVYPAILPFQDVRLEGITFFGMRLNGIPIFIPPVAEEIRLEAGRRFELRRPLDVSVYYRDLSSLQPLIEVIRSSRLHLEGSAVFEARVSLLPALALRSRTARAPSHFAVDVPVSLPGNRFTQEAALKVLEVAEPGSKYVRGKVVALIDSSEARENVLRQYGSGLLFALARYQVADRGGKRYPLQIGGIAFRVNPRQFVVVRELVEPWRFDAALATEIKAKRLTVVEGSYDLLLWPRGARVSRPGGGVQEDQAYSFLKKQFRLVAGPGNSTDRLVAARGTLGVTLVTTLQRASKSNLALAEFESPPALAGEPAANIERRPDPNGYSRLVVFRFGAGSWMDTADPEIVNVSVRISNDRLILDDPIDASALGSPMVSDNGVVGILQDERSGILFTTVADALKLAGGK